MNKKALFLDRDGTINIDKHYVSEIDDFEFRPEIFDIILSYQNKGYLIIIVTNQSGIARKYYSENQFQKLTHWMIQHFRKKNIEISGVYHCPHHPKITGHCSCRKPEPGLILAAINDFGINPKQSVLIGDKKSDILAGKNAGIGKNLYIQDLIEQ